MATISIDGQAVLGGALSNMVSSNDIILGDQPSYQLCKDIYLYHPLGAKIAEKPIELAQSQPRKITIPDSPEDVVLKQFMKGWEQLKADERIFDHWRWARVYGISALAVRERGVADNQPVDFKNLWKHDLEFSNYDPLNVAGSLVLNQDPNAFDFQRVVNGIAVSGQPFHRSRAVVVMNESPVYVAYQSSTFGFTGRSVYQRALYPLKTFISTMRADDMAARKVGLLVAKIKQGGSFLDNIMTSVTSIKRSLLKDAETDNVISIGEDDDIQSLNLQNLNQTLEQARKDCLENIASAVPMPAKLLTQETFAEGFGEGTEDSKQIAMFVDRVRKSMRPSYDFMDHVVQCWAWNPDFYETIRRRFPEEYGDVPFETAFYRWRNSFTWEWPNLLKEPDSELIKVDDVKLRAVIALLEVLLPLLDPENKLIAIEWACDAFNELRLLFGDPLEFDYDAMGRWQEEQRKKMDLANQSRDEEGGGDAKGFGMRADTALVEFRRSLDQMSRKRA